ncbi:MAG: leucine--tRNA ligase [Candidatus Saccharimonadales bacterium]
MKRYNPKNIEPLWQKRWSENGIYKAGLKSNKPKYIAMSMFNYPSGAGIHIGHAMNYTISDVKARLKRQQGYESYHPIGWDAFGLPAENYAIKAGVSPQKSMARIIPSYHKQYKAMGWSNDWSKEISTHEPEYYKWTQWIFSQMYKNKLAYKDARMQWWCNKCQTVLANEQVIDGKCWRHDGKDDPEVEKKQVKQWFFKITEYADELLDAIDELDWTESVKIAQRNWIGRSIGAEIDFKIDDSKDKLAVFTTRHDTQFGVTFLVLAPEHPIVKKITKKTHEKSIMDYVKQASFKSDVERQKDEKNKTGVFTGAYAVNPANKEKIPIWIADYVLLGYGTGAVMGVPAHDDRDNEFAEKYGLKIQRVLKTDDDSDFHSEGIVVNSGKYDGMRSEQMREEILKDFVKARTAKEKVNYKMRDWSVSRQRYWGAPIPIIDCPKCGDVLVEDKDLPVVLPELDDFKPSGDGRSALGRAKDWLQVDCPKCGGKAERETDTLDTYICSSWYMFRYFDPRNDQKIFDKELVNKWMPIDFYNGGDHATAHLLYARFITKFFNKIGLVDNPEPFKKMLFNGKVTASDGSAFSKSKGIVIDPLEIIDSGYGADALRMYLMFAAPLEFGARWDPQGVPGTFRFLTRLWNLVNEYSAVKPGELSKITKEKLRRAEHSMIKKSSNDLEHSRYNTAIASYMACLNEYYKLKEEEFFKNDEWTEALKSLIMCVAPFAPHISEELWSELGGKGSVCIDNWPVHDEKYLEQDIVNIVVQVNGKLRANIEVTAGSTEQEVIETAKDNEKVKKQLENKKVRKNIYVPGKLVNFVV